MAAVATKTIDRPNGALVIRFTELEVLPRSSFKSMIEQMRVARGEEKEGWKLSVHMDDTLAHSLIAETLYRKGDSILGVPLFIHETAPHFERICELRLYPEADKEQMEQRDFPQEDAIYHE